LTSAQLTLSSVIAFEYPARLDGEVERGEEGELKSQVQVVIVLGTVRVVSLGRELGKGWGRMGRGRRTVEFNVPLHAIERHLDRIGCLKLRDTYKDTSKKITNLKLQDWRSQRQRESRNGKHREKEEAGIAPT